MEIYTLTKCVFEVLGITNGDKIPGDGHVCDGNWSLYGGDFMGGDLVKLSTGYDYLKGVIEVALVTLNEPAFNE